MKITNQNETQMVIRQSAATDYLFGALFIFLGILLLVGIIPTDNQAKLILGVILLAMGLLTFVTAKKQTIIIDRSKGVFSIEATGLFGSKKQEVTMSDIVGIHLEEKIKYSVVANSPGEPSVSNRNQKEYYSSAVLKNGAEILFSKETPSTLTVFSFFLFSPEGNKIRNTDERIAEFIGVPLRV